MSPRNWRERPAGRRTRRWRPWVSLLPRGSGSRINEPKSVGLRDLVAEPSEVGSRPELRWRLVGSLFVALLVVVIVRLVFLQVVDHPAAVAAVNENSLRTSVVYAPRGEIRDRNGYVLVGNKTSVELQISRAQAEADPTVVGALSGLTGLSVADITSKVDSVQYLAYQPVPILTNTPPAVVEYVRLHPSEFPGVTLVDGSTRYYPLGGTIAPHVTGYVGPITGAEIAANPKAHYPPDSAYGQNGIERFYENYLRGRDGTETLRVDALGNVLGVAKVTKPVPGDSVVLNMDAGLQKAVGHALSLGVERDRHTIDPVSGVYPPAPNGAAIVLNVRTGAVLALASYPGYDVSTLVNGLSESEYRKLEADYAFDDNAIQGLYTPGSTFKLITSTAELQTGIFSARQYVNDTGSFTVPGCDRQEAGAGCVFHDDDNEGTGQVNLPLALTRSSDYYFYNLGYLFWSERGRYGDTPIQDVASQYGLGHLTHIDLPFESVGRVDSQAEREKLHRLYPQAFPNTSWYTGDNIEMAFGQGATALTPIEMADAYATFANGGTRYQPEVAAGIVSPTGQVVRQIQPRVLGHVYLPGSIRDPILSGLEGVVNNPTGTAYLPFHTYADFNLNDYVIAGKTGTASNQANQEPNSWFIGFGPNPDPKYLVMAVIGQGGYGADGAAPIVAQIFNYLVHHPLGPVELSARHLVISTSATVR